MIKYTTIIDNKTGLCNVGLGTNDRFYNSLGMTQKDVEQGFDGKWYLKESLETDEYKNKLLKHRQDEFNSKFFNTSIGWIKRNVIMKNGSSKDFLCDILPQIKSALELNETVNIITYQTPDFNNNLSEEYLKSLQEIKTVDLDFVKECLLQASTDFFG